MEHDWLLDISTNTVSILSHIKCDHYYYEEVNGHHYIRFDGLNKVEKGETGILEYKLNDNSLLVDYINIGDFIYREMLNGNESILDIEDKKCIDNFDIDSERDKVNLFCILRVHPLFDSLVKKIINFCYKHGNYTKTKWIREDNKPRPILDNKMEVKEFIYQAYRIYLIFINLYVKKNFENSIEMRLSSIKSNLSITPVIINSRNGELKVNVNYDFERLFDVAVYQLLISLNATEAQKICLCEYCNTFFSSARKQKFCCYAHKNQSYTGLKYQKTKECPHCKKLFAPAKQSQIYCSPECKMKANNLVAKNKRRGL